MKQLWSRNPNGILNFKKLRIIEVGNCDELRDLFPISVAKDLSKLEYLSTLHCTKMVEIASQSASDTDPLEFPELTYLRIYGLLNSKHFCKGREPVKCPELKELIIGECPELKVFLKETGKTVLLAEKVNNVSFLSYF